jgi:hypothetical protein
VVGGALGLFGGGALGVRSANGCTDEFCALGPALLGAGLGESIGLAVGVHIGSRGRANPLETSLMNMGILAAGLLVAAAAPSGLQEATLVLIPVTQLGLTLLMEDH